MPLHPLGEHRARSGPTQSTWPAVRHRRRSAARLCFTGLLVLLATACAPFSPPVPTATPVPPTATPLPPTPTPLPPTPTPRPEPSPEVRAYLDWLRPHADLAELALAGLAAQHHQVVQDRGVFRDQDWLLPTRAALANLATAGNALQLNGRVPAGVKDLDALVVAIGEELVALSDAYAEGLARVDTQNMAAATERLSDLESKLQEAVAEVRRLGGD
jgi:hypothetical protein